MSAYVSSKAHDIAASLLSCNDPPSADEEAHLRAYIHSLRSRQLLVDDAGCDAQLPRLELADLEGILSPARRLPNEIIGDIMLHAFWDTSSKDNILNTKRRRGVWACSEVCQRWRYIVLNLPPLWTSINLSLVHRDLHSFTLYRLRLALTNSKNAPLNVTLYVRSPLIAADPLDPMVDDILQAIFSHSFRWQRLEIDMELHYDWVRIFHRLSNLSMLRSLRIHDQSRSFMNLSFPATVLKPFHSAPKLESVWLESAVKSGTTSTIRPSSLPLPWGQLVQFHCEILGFLPEYKLLVLRNMPNLDELELTEEIYPHQSLPPILLPNLRKFSALSKCIASGILSIFDFPSLEEVDIRRQEKHNSLALINLQSFLRPSSIRSLTLGGICGETVNLIQSLPDSLESLSIGPFYPLDWSYFIPSPEVYHSLIEALCLKITLDQSADTPTFTSVSPQKINLPNLKSLSLSFILFPHMNRSSDVNAIIGMVKSRLVPVVPPMASSDHKPISGSLQKFRCDFDKSHDPEIVERLREVLIPLFDQLGKSASLQINN
jgi:hypothetical protein